MGPTTSVNVAQVCADCGKKGLCPYVDTDRNGAPICAECYQRWKELRRCETCGREN